MRVPSRDTKTETRQQHLRATRPEYLSPHRPEPQWSKFQADQEQQKDDAKLGDRQNALDVLEQPETEGTDKDAGTEIAEHGADPQPAADRGRDRRRCQQHRRFRQKCMLHHVPSGSPAAHALCRSAIE